MKKNKSAEKDAKNLKQETSFIEKQSITNILEPIQNSKISIFGDEYVLNLAQTKLEFNPVEILTNEYLELSTQTSNRFTRFLLSFFIVMISSMLCFLLVKYSIDWVNKLINK